MVHELVDELYGIECYLELGKGPVRGEVLMKRELLYLDLGEQAFNLSTGTSVVIGAFRNASVDSHESRGKAQK